MGKISRASPKMFRLTLASVPRNVGKVEQFLKKVDRVLRLDEIQFHKLMVSLTEAVNNAIIHGNGANPTKKVRVFCEIKDDEVCFSVADEGPGFAPERVRNPLKEENLLRESGRGIFLMRTLMDRVEFIRKPNGMDVRLWLRLKY